MSTSVIKDETEPKLSEAAVVTVEFITHGWEDFKTCTIPHCWKCYEYLERWGAKKIVYPQSIMKTKDIHEPETVSPEDSSEEESREILSVSKKSINK